MSESPPADSSTSVFTDHDSLMHDFQSLLTDVELCDASILVSSEKSLAIPSQVLRARSPYFDAMLSPRWEPTPPAHLEKPNAPVLIFQDLLEFLVTGSVTLGLATASIPHNVAVAALSHEVGCEELETVAVQHIRTHLTLQNLPLYLDTLISPPRFPDLSSHHLHPSPHPLPPPPLLEEALVDFAAAHAAELPPALATASWPVTRALWRMLVNAHAADPLQRKELSAVARALASYTDVDAGCVRRAGDLLEDEPSADRNAMLALLSDVPPVTFSKAIEPTGLFTPEQLVDKYRRDAMASPDVPRRPRTPRFRVLCESRHPYPRGVRLEDSVQRVVVRAERGWVCHSLLKFDPRSSLGGGSELAFYTSDPALGTHPHTFLVGRQLPAELVIPAGEFWYAFASTDANLVPTTWGWRFFVEPVAPEIEDID